MLWFIYSSYNLSLLLVNISHKHDLIISKCIMDLTIVLILPSPFFKSILKFVVLLNIYLLITLSILTIIFSNPKSRNHPLVLEERQHKLRGRAFVVRMGNLLESPKSCTLCLGLFTLWMQVWEVTCPKWTWSSTNMCI